MRVGTIHFTASLAALITTASAQSNMGSDPRLQCPTQCKDCPGGKFGVSYAVDNSKLVYRCYKCPGGTPYLDDDVCTPPAGCDVAEPVTPSYLMNPSVDF